MLPAIRASNAKAAARLLLAEFSGSLVLNLKAQRATGLRGVTSQAVRLSRSSAPKPQCTVRYQWEGKPVFYQTRLSIVYPNNKPVYIKGRYAADGKHIRSACENIIHYSNEDDAAEAWAEIEGLGEYLPVLIAYLEGEIHSF